MNPSRRRFLFSAAATLIAAPAIVRAAIIMPISTLAIPRLELAPIYDHPTSLDVTISPETLERAARGDKPIRWKPRATVPGTSNESAWNEAVWRSFPSGDIPSVGRCERPGTGFVVSTFNPFRV